MEAGIASLELIDRNHKNFIDEMEVGKSGVAGDVRIALNLGSSLQVTRVKDANGMQITLFETSTL